MSRGLLLAIALLAACSANSGDDAGSPRGSSATRRSPAPEADSGSSDAPTAADPRRSW